MTILRISVFLAGIAFLGLCIQAGLAGDFKGEFSQISGLPWGKVSLADLYLGFLAFAVVIVLTEKLSISIPMILALLVLGNVVAAFWLAWRLPRIAQKLRA